MGLAIIFTFTMHRGSSAPERGKASHLILGGKILSSGGSDRRGCFPSQSCSDRRKLHDSLDYNYGHDPPRPPRSSQAARRRLDPFRPPRRRLDPSRPPRRRLDPPMPPRRRLDPPRRPRRRLDPSRPPRRRLDPSRPPRRRLTPWRQCPPI
ncbi:unnamed protein product [Prunus armeniaca]